MGNNGAKSAAEDPDGYIERLFKEVSETKKPTYFSLLPVDLYIVIGSYITGALQSRERYFSRMDSLPDFRRRPPALRVDDVIQCYGANFADPTSNYAPIYVGKYADRSDTRNYTTRLAKVMSLCFLPKDDEPIALFDTTVFRSADDFILYTRHGMYTRFDYEINGCRQQFIPWSKLVTEEVIANKRHLYLGSRCWTGNAFEPEKHKAALIALKAVMTKKVGPDDLEYLNAPSTHTERILELLQTKFQNKFVYYLPAIPHFHLKAAFKAAACDPDMDDTVLALLDNADVGVASLCLIVTRKWLYWANSDKEHFKLSLTDLTAKDTTIINHQGKSIRFEPSGLLLYTGYNRCNWESEFLRKLQTLLREIEAEEKKKLQPEGDEAQDKPTNA